MMRTTGTATKVIGIERLHRIQQRREISSQRCGSDEAYRQTNQRQPRRVTEHETHHVRRRSTHRDAHAELTDSLLDGVREDAEHANHRESQRHCRERSDKDSAEPWPRCRFGGDDVDRSHARDWPLLVDARDRGTHRRQQRLGGRHSAASQ